MSASSSTFAGVWPTDITAAKLHELDEKLVEERIFEVTRSLIRHGDVGVICLGCAPMSDLDRVARQACISELGEVQGSQVKIVDGVIAGVLLLDSMLRLDCYFPPQSDLEPFPSNI